MSEQSKKLIINPAFKKQLLLLKKNALDELQIQISLDKMVNDKQYRQTFLNELDGLGSESFNDIVAQLKRIPVYIESTATNSEPSVATPPATETPIVEKKSSFIPIFISLLVVALIAFSAWKLGFINVNTQKIVAASVESNAALSTAEVVTEPVVIAPVVVPEQKVAEPATPKIATLPSDESIVSIRLHGSNTLNAGLMPVLLESYLRKKGISEIKWLVHTQQFERELQYIDNNKVYSIKLDSHGSSSGFKALLNEEADIAVASRKILDAEIEMLRPRYGNLSRTRSEFTVGLDGIAVIVNPENNLKSLTNEMLAKVFSGEINNWKHLGGEDATINVYSRNSGSGTLKTFKNIVLESNELTMSAQATQIKSSHDLSEQIANDLHGIGFVSLHYVHENNKVAIAASQETEILYPTRFTVSTEDYLLSRRLFLYMPTNVNPFIKGFSRFVASQEGQDIVEGMGFVSQNIKLEKAHNIANAPAAYNNYVNVGKRLSVDFRFESGGNELDTKGKHDIKRLVDFISEHPSHRLALMGFSDSLGEVAENKALSLVRARALEKELNAYGVDVSAIESFGASVPIASNKSAIGRSKNRRVEVWVF
ncbi:cell envelope biogenesis protein OmpA [Psychromonas sp. psych-6C06]|uniref:phosphate ABC transporter substrate-binding/OmpA family protein n=1 Tax=Psychromonas sp. psych-6C06 TaxID=2058089 RepID=UPI000C31C9A1|nr:phosphate ABC transporter substrate-binding/OmpA family protein [Psychromonas sp. psych-6C06]PKF62629.1 cell envelope biogenesis protein OmpA [Psychromonas sp. psych-6C06]